MPNRIVFEPVYPINSMNECIHTINLIYSKYVMTCIYIDSDISLQESSNGSIIYKLKVYFELKQK